MYFVQMTHAPRSVSLNQLLADPTIWMGVGQYSEDDCDDAYRRARAVRDTPEMPVVRVLRNVKVDGKVAKVLDCVMQRTAFPEKRGRRKKRAA